MAPLRPTQTSPSGPLAHGPDPPLPASATRNERSPTISSPRGLFMPEATTVTTGEDGPAPAGDEANRAATPAIAARDSPRSRVRVAVMEPLLNGALGPVTYRT